MFIDNVVVKPEGAKYLEGLGKEGNIILKYILKIQDQRTWTSLI
jgi:hypothetical protein